jgi:hypothetical protein
VGQSAQLDWSVLDAGKRVRFVSAPRSQRDGRFALAELPANGVILRISDPKWALTSKAVHTLPGEIGEVSIVAHRGTTIRLVFPNEYDGANAVLHGENNLPVWRLEDISTAIQYTVRLAPGQYLGEISKGSTRRTKTVVVGRGTAELDFAP